MLSATYLCDDIFELTLLPGLSWMSHHRQHCIVVLFVLVVEEDQLRPEVGLLSCTKHLHVKCARVANERIKKMKMNGCMDTYTIVRVL